MCLSLRRNPVGKLCSVLVAFLFTLSFTSLLAQNQNTGEIRGTVTDSSGARVNAARVVVTNVDTGIATRVVADAGGIYDAPLLQPGPYSIEFSKQGFRKFVRQGITLHVEVITVNATLNVGSINESVTVTADVSLVQTETSDRNFVLTEKTINDLPNVGRSWFDLTGQLPGVNPGGNSNGGGQDASGAGVGVNGNPGYMENFLTDGGVTTLPVSQNPGVGVPLDDIAEVDMNTSNFSAEYGSGVAVFNVITKSGSNQFHGSLYEFVQNDIFEARNWFVQPVPPLNGAPAIPAVAPLRWNMYGGTIGGPIRRNKAFFYFSYQSNPSISYSPMFYTFPTTAMKNGDFSALLGGPLLNSNNNPVINPCDGSQEMVGQIYDPATTRVVGGQTCRTAFAGNIIPSNRIDSLANNIQAFFPLPNIPGVSGGGGIANNFYYNARNTNYPYIYSGKLDYDVSASNRLSGSVQVDPGKSYNPAPTCPVATNSSSGCQKSWGTDSTIQITDAWTISPGLVNEARVSFLRQYGIWSAPDVGTGFPAKIGLPNAPADIFPNINIGGGVSTSLGGGLTAKLGFNSFMYSDTVSWSKGKHLWKFGGEFNRWQDNQYWNNIDSGDYDFNGNFTLNPSDLTSSNPTNPIGYADFLLGAPDTWGVTMSPETGLRAWNMHAFANDDFKITPHLTLNLGVRYTVQTGWSEVENRFANFDPTLPNPGPTDPNLPGFTTGKLGALCYAGQTFGTHHCPTAQTKTIADIFDPRIGFAWSPKDTWSIRGAYGIFGEMNGANNYTLGFAPGWAIQGSLNSPDNGVFTPAFFPLSQGPPAGSIIFPNAAMRTPDLLNGQGASYVDYNARAAYVQQWHFSIQHELLGHIGFDAGYVGSRGVHLLFPRDINQIPQALLGQAAAAANVNLFRPYPQYPGGIGSNLFDGISNYHSFQFSARAVASHGLSFRVNYTFSKALDETTTSGWCCTSDNYQNAFNPRANYGPTVSDIPQLLNGSFVYELPFGQGKAMLNQGAVLNGFLGGWQLSSVFQLHSGLPFTPVMLTNNSFSQAGAQYPNRICNGTLADPTINQWFDSACFAQPATATFGDSGRNILRGPKWRNMNLSLGKNFGIRKLGERGQLQVRVDAFDIFNHPNFGMPNPNIGDSAVGVITSANTSRNLQLGAKLSF